jgi:hypothetical protein
MKKHVLVPWIRSAVLVGADALEEASEFVGCTTCPLGAVGALMESAERLFVAGYGIVDVGRKWLFDGSMGEGSGAALLSLGLAAE